MTWFDIIMLTIVAITFIRGYMSGLVTQLATLAGLIVGAIFAGQLAGIISPYVKSLFESSSHIINPLCYLLAFLIIMISFYLLGRMISKTLKIVKINTLNKLAGGVFSSLKWLFVVSILLNIILTIDHNKSLIAEDIRTNSYSYSYIKSVAPYIIPFLKFDNRK